MRMKDRRKIEAGQLVKVYRNLHKDCFSVADVKTGLVLGYAETVRLEGVRFVVRSKGRDRVRELRRKEVHAYVVGNFVEADRPRCGFYQAVYYDPYRVDSFVIEETGQEVNEAAAVVLEGSRAYIEGVA